MKLNYPVILVVLTIMIMCLGGCAFSSEKPTEVESSKDWAFHFVIWNGNMYIKTSETVKIIGEQLGEVEHYSDDETDVQTDLYSNFFPEGSQLFSIEGVSTASAIAVEQTNGSYLKLESRNRGGYN